jgi:hypothetical protein
MADDDALKFKVDLVGNMVQELVASGKAASTAEGGVQALTGAIIELTEASKKKEEHGFFTFDLAEGAKMAAEFVEGLAEKVYDLGKEIIGTAAHAQDLGVALKLDVGEEGASRVGEIAESFKDTRFGPERIKQELLPLLEVGLGKDDPGLIKDITTAAIDIAARKNDQAAFGETLAMFQRIHTRDKVNPKMLASLGINDADFFTALGETIGKSKDEAEKAVKAGKVKAETLEAELLGQIAKREGGSLGKGTDESVKTLGTTLERLKRLPEDLFVQLADSPGLKLLEDRADQFINTLSGPAGERVVAVLGGAIDKVGAAILGDGDAADKLVKGISDLSEGLPKAIALMGELWDDAKGLLSALSPVMDWLASRSQRSGAGQFNTDESEWFQTDYHGQVAQNLPGGGKHVLTEEERNAAVARGGGASWLDGEVDLNRKAVLQLRKEFETGGWQVGNGLAEGIKSAVPVVQDAAKELTSCAIATVDKEAKIQSPSRVMIDRGGYLGEGLAMGMEGSAGRVQSAARASLVDTVMGNATAAPPAGAQGGPMTFAPTYAPQFTVGPGASVEEAAHRAEEEGRVWFGRMVDEARARLGAPV